MWHVSVARCVAALCSSLSSGTVSRATANRGDQKQHRSDAAGAAARPQGECFTACSSCQPVQTALMGDQFLAASGMMQRVCMGPYQTANTNRTVEKSKFELE
jgi:hypothetical protein